MKRLLTILLIAISAVASAQTYQLNYPDIRIGNSNTGKIVLRGSNVQFPFLGLGSITDSVVTIVGGVFKKVPRSQFSGGGSSYTFNNGLTNTGGVVGLGGSLLSSTQVNLLDKSLLVANTATFLGGKLYVGNDQSFLQYDNGSYSGGFFAQDSLSLMGYGAENSLEVNAQKIILRTTDNNNGAYYASDYSIGRTFPADNLWIPTAGWVNAQIAAASGGGGGSVSSVFGRTGAVTAQSADYNAFYPLLASTYNNPTWINTLAYSKITGVPSFITSESDPTVPAYAKSLTAFSVIKTSTDALYEPIFSKNTAFNKNFGAESGTVAEGNDTRIVNAVPNTRTISPGTGLTGGGDLTTNRTLAVDTTTIRTVANSYTLAALQTKFNNYLTTASASATYVPLTRTVSTGNGLSGGGALSGNLTLTADTSILATKANTKTLAQLQTAFNTKQNTLVSGTNIKTVNGNSLLGSGDLVIGSGTPDTTVYRTVANSRTLAQTQTALNLKVDKTTTLTNGYGINTIGDLSANRTVSVDTTSSNGVVSKSRLTASLGNWYYSARFSGAATLASPFELATVTVPFGGTGATTLTGLVKGNGTSAFSAAVAGTDYLTPTGSAAGLTSFPTFNQNTTGSAATLTTTRTIWGQNFNGSANVTGALSGATTINASGIVTGSSFTGAGTGLTGTASSLTAGNATKLATARTIGTTGITSTAASFDGSANVNIAVTAVPGSVVTGNITGSATGTTLEQVATANPNTTKTLSVFNVAKDNSLILNADIYSYPYIQGANQNQNATKVLLINPNGGNVLVGTTTDNTVDKLQVNGSISATNLSAGTYTPTGTITDVSGTVTSITPLLTHYSRIGNQVNVSGAVTFNTATTSTGVTIEVTLPIASNMTSGDDAWGTGTVPIPITNYSANSGVTGNPTTDKAKIILNTLSGTFTLYYQYMYTIK